MEKASQHNDRMPVEFRRYLDREGITFAEWERRQQASQAERDQNDPFASLESQRRMNELKYSKGKRA